MEAKPSRCEIALNVAMLTGTIEALQSGRS